MATSMHRGGRLLLEESPVDCVKDRHRSPSLRGGVPAPADSLRETWDRRLADLKLSVSQRDGRLDSSCATRRNVARGNRDQNENQRGRRECHRVSPLDAKTAASLRDWRRKLPPQTRTSNRSPPGGPPLSSPFAKKSSFVDWNRRRPCTFRIDFA